MCVGVDGGILLHGIFSDEFAFGLMVIYGSVRVIVVLEEVSYLVFYRVCR